MYIVNVRCLITMVVLEFVLVVVIIRIKFHVRVVLSRNLNGVMHILLY